MKTENYTAPITRKTPTAFVFLLDQSGSMNEHTVYDGISMTKAEALSMATNALIDELLDRSRRNGGINDYYHIAILGYSGEGVRDILNGFATPSQLEQYPIPTQSVMRERTLPNGTRITTTTHYRQWIKPVATGMTPMYEALNRALILVDNFCSQEPFRASYPPTIFNITDGEATDATDSQLLGIAQQIKNIGTSDGAVLLANMNLSKGNGQHSVLFPTSTETLPKERYAQLLYQMSSPMPQRCNADIIHLCPQACSGPFRAMSYNATIGDIVAMLNIGTISL